MAAASLSSHLFNSQLRRPGFSTSRRRCNPFSSLSLRAFNGDRDRSPEEQARIGLQQLDDQLSETSSPSSPRSPFQSPEEQAKIGLQQLDDQLSQTSSPSSPRSPLPGTRFAGKVRIFTEGSLQNVSDQYGTDIDDFQRKVMSKKGSLPDFSDGFLVFLAGGLLLLTVVNNFLFYYFVERPSQDSQVTQQTEGKKLDSGKLSVDDNKAAPQPQASSDM